MSGSAAGECCCQPVTQVGWLAVEKSGWLSVKRWLVHKRRRLQLAERRRWRPMWACLRGPLLLLYKGEPPDGAAELTGGGGGSGGSGRRSQGPGAPHGCLVIEGGIAQAMPEHPKRDCVLALSTAQGEAFMIQAPSTIEMDSWIRTIHAACAVQLAQRSGELDPVKLLRQEIARVESNMDMDTKTHRMASLRLSSVGPPSRDSLGQWDEEAEAMSVQLYRLRCYLASLLFKEVPNPMTTLSTASKATKQSLGRLGQLSMTLFHALVTARSGEAAAAIGSSAPVAASHQHMRTSSLRVERSVMSTSASESGFAAAAACDTRSFSESQFMCRLQKRQGNRQFGITVEAELRSCPGAETGRRELCLVVTGVEPGSAAEMAGLEVGDEVQTVDGHRVGPMEMSEVERMFDVADGLSLRILRPSMLEATSSVRMRSRSLNRSVSVAAPATPAPGVADLSRAPQFRRQPTAGSSRSSDSASIRNANSLASWSNRSDSPSLLTTSSRSAAEAAVAMRSAVAELLRAERDQGQVLLELQGLCQQLLTRWRPQATAEVCPQGSSGAQELVLAQLAGSARQLAEFHARFLVPVAEAASGSSGSAGDSLTGGGPGQTRDSRNMLLTVAGTFLHYDTDLNMLYCHFCLCSLKCAKLLCQDAPVIQYFSEANGRNSLAAHPSAAPTGGWDRLLMRPLELISGYSPLLDILRGCARVGSEEQIRLAEALKNMRLLADRVGTLRALDREYGAKFDQLSCLYRRVHPNKPPVYLSLDQLLLYGSVEWLNAVVDGGVVVGEAGGESDAEDSAWRTGCFVFASAVALVRRHRLDVGGLHCQQAVVPVGEARALSVGSETRGHRWPWDLIVQASGSPDEDRRMERVYKLSCRSLQARDDFLKAVNDAAEAARTNQMSVSLGPTTNSTIAAEQSKAARSSRPQPPRRSSSQPSTQRVSYAYSDSTGVH